MNDAFFEKAVNQIILIEGGYSNKPSDKGGATKYGITEKVARQNGYTGDMRYLPGNKAKEIYYKQYWLQSKADKVAIMSFNIAFLLFDFGVNSGVKNAVKKIQKVFNEKYGINPKLAIDGVFGNKTLNAFNTLQSYKKDNEFIFIEFEKYYISEILKYYTSLKNPNTGFSKNGAGWVNRVANNINFLNGL